MTIKLISLNFLRNWSIGELPIENKLARAIINKLEVGKTFRDMKVSLLKIKKTKSKETEQKQNDFGFQLGLHLMHAFQWSCSATSEQKKHFHCPVWKNAT